MVAIISHDAGGAEILSSWVKRQNEECIFVIDGPANKIFFDKLGNVSKVTLEEAIELCDWILCGTSWQSDLEIKAIKTAKLKNKKTIAFLDHWVNYKERFFLNSELILPDKIWVGDKYAEKIANKHFLSVPVVLKKNPYFQDLVESIKFFENKDKNNNKNSILYLCEPIEQHALLKYGDEKYWGYTEVEALKYFISNLDFISNKVNKVIIRPHPSEDKNKYDWSKNFSNLISISKDTLLQDIANSDIVVGSESMAMVVGLLAKKRVISCIPPGGPACRLPQKNIENLSLLLNKTPKL